MTKKVIQVLCAGASVVLLMTACTKEEKVEDNGDNGHVYNWEKHVPFESDYEVMFVPQNTADYVSDPINVGPLLLEESSGVAASINNAGMLWTHEDSNNGNWIYLIDAATAEIVCSYRVSGATNTDWEDMEVISDPVTGKAYIYISDTGDNDQKRGSVVIYRLEEPHYTAADKGKIVETSSASLERYPFQYSDGSKDVESMFVDRDSKDIYLVTKRDERSRLYVFPSPKVGDGMGKAHYVGNFGFKEASAATANINGTKFIVRNRQYIFYWERRASEKMWEVFKRTPERLPLAQEIQGEAVCFDKDDNYYTTSENGGRPVHPPVYKYLKK